MKSIRVGFGFDVHQFAEGRELWLGGIQLPYDRGLLGHSDADVLLHAVCDALLGAANLRDIGFQFPDTDAAFKNIDSKILLRRTMELIRSKGYELGNIDATICAEKPKINPYIDQMKICMADVMAVDSEDISIKATTSEKMGFVGREEGMTAYVSVLLVPKLI
jgi:2-C-methyl-D-erythritol 2,4-cyclodiphosphate synthase